MTLSAFCLRPLVIPMAANAVPGPEARAQEHGRLIKERRLDLGLDRPAFVAEMARHGQDITPDYLNKLENGRAPLSRASLPVRKALRIVLGFSGEEWQEATGLYVSPVSPVSAPTTGTRPLPQGLQAAIDVYGKRFSDLLDPVWQQYMAKFRWRKGQPEDAESWLDLYRDLSRAGIVPGEK
jgi:hypothetical protein